MKSGKWDFYTTKEYTPRGWLRRQLLLQANGLCGHLDQVWNDVRDSAWIGGGAESWERVPYWLDGFIPLAYLLRDDALIARAKRYIDAILAHQQEDGWICPCTKEERHRYDTWAVLLIAKVLSLYHDCSGDDRVPAALYRVFQNYYELLQSGEIKLFEWGKFRWFEGLPAIEKIYSLYREDWLLDLAETLRRQGQDYGELTEKWQTPLNKWTFETHIVNLCMALKTEAVTGSLLHAPYEKRADKWAAILEKYNGTPVGLFTGDECLSGRSPIQGTELCAVVEQMYSYELLYATTGDKQWAEALELIAFNALPATISDDMWAHRYVQQSNQISCEKLPGRPVFRTNNGEAHLFGLEPNYGCCTANFGQGWPKLALSSFLHRGRTILSAVPLPGELRTVIDGHRIHIALETDYPFRNTFTYRIDCDADASFTLAVRIPSFAVSPVLGGQPVASGRTATIDIHGEATVTLSFDTAPRLINRPHGLKSVRCGSLVFALPIAYEAKRHEYESGGVKRAYPYCDYEYIGRSGWQYALCSADFVKEEQPVSDVPFASDAPPVVLKAQCKPIDWGYEDGFETVCAKTPRSKKPLGDARGQTLIPYGCAKLRITELPLIK